MRVIDCQQSATAKSVPNATGTVENVFMFADRQAGVNFPPMHPMCRCTFEIVVDDWNKWLDDYEKKHSDSEKQIENRLLKNFADNDIIKTDYIVSEDSLKNIEYIEINGWGKRECLLQKVNKFNY